MILRWLPIAAGALAGAMLNLRWPLFAAGLLVGALLAGQAQQATSFEQLEEIQWPS